MKPPSSEAFARQRALALADTVDLVRRSVAAAGAAAAGEPNPDKAWALSLAQRRLTSILADLQRIQS